MRATRLASRSLAPLVAAALFAVPALAQGETAAGAADRGLVTGLRGFEGFHEPLGQPLYFESPFNDTNLRGLYLRHNFSNDSTLQGGNVTVYALQARLAVTERLGIIATEDGYSELEAGIAEADGWNDLALGAKYVAVADREARFVLTPGLRYRASNGSRRVLQGGVQEISGFVSFGKGWDDLHLLGGAALRVPLDSNDGNLVGHWDLHLDYSLNPDSDAVVAPLLEVHGVHYLEDGDLALDVGGLDYANLGSQPAESFVAWAEVGARLEIDRRFELGLCYGFALTDADDDIFEDRITFDFITRF